MSESQTIRAGILAVEVQCPVTDDQRRRIEEVLKAHSAKLAPYLTRDIGEILGYDMVKK